MVQSHFQRWEIERYSQKSTHRYSVFVSFKPLWLISNYTFVVFRAQLCAPAPPLRCTHLDFLAVDVDQPLPEVDADRGLRLAGEPAGAEAVGETRLADARIADNDDLKDAGPGRWELAGVGQGAWRSLRRASLCHLTARLSGLHFQKLPSLSNQLAASGGSSGSFCRTNSFNLVQ